MPVELNTRYGRLMVIGQLARSSKGHSTWICNCACGSVLIVVRGDQLTTGKTRSCGCARRSSLGLSNSPTYKTWAAMRRRCNDVNHPRYEDYGGRGITVCERWNDRRKGFAAFVEDMGLRPNGLTLDRIDVEKGYEKSNCRWATLIEQRWNRRDMQGQGRAERDAETAYWNEQEQAAAAVRSESESITATATV